VEIDGEVIHYSQKYLPEISLALDDPKVDVRVEDGIAYLQQRREEFDVILIDSTEPVGPAVGLFSRQFYASVYRALRPQGILIAQTESPFFNQDILLRAYSGMKAEFPITRTYLASVPTYPSGLWSFTLASKRWHPLEDQRQPPPGFKSRYYTPEIHCASFALPQFVQEILEQA